MKLSDEIRDYSCHIDSNGEDHIVETVRLDRWQRLAADLEALYSAAIDVMSVQQIWMRKERANKILELETENQRLRGALEAILKINWGYDGDCGATRIAEQALEKET